MADSLSRRSFLATTSAAAAVAATAPEASAIIRPLPPKLTDRDFYYVTERPLSDGRPDAGLYVRVKGEPKERWESDNPAEQTRRRRFKPMELPARFRLMVGQWWDSDNAKDEVEELPPTSYVAVPKCLRQDDETINEEYPLLTRAEGWEAVAAYNRDTFEDYYPLCNWALLLEYAPLVEAASLSSVCISATGVGNDERHTTHPVRIVFPTDAELARYAIAKGGA